MRRNGALVKPDQEQRSLPHEYHRLVSAPHKTGLGKKPVKLL
jgi:hypothetical protein